MTNISSSRYNLSLPNLENKEWCFSYLKTKILLQMLLTRSLEASKTVNRLEASKTVNRNPKTWKLQKMNSNINSELTNNNVRTYSKTTKWKGSSNWVTKDHSMMSSVGSKNIVQLANSKSSKEYRRNKMGNYLVGTLPRARSSSQAGLKELILLILHY